MNEREIVRMVHRQVDRLRKTGELAPEKLVRGDGDKRRDHTGNPEWVRGNVPNRWKEHRL